LQALGQSLLGNTYDSVTMDLSARDLSATSTRTDDDSYFKAGTLHVTAALSDVEPRDWGGADVTLRFGDVDQVQFVPDSALRVDEAVLRVSGSALPVADMMAAVMTLAEPPRQYPVDATKLLDGLLGFGKLEMATEGKAIWLEEFGQRYDNGDYKKVTEFETSFDKWAVNVALEGVNRNEGRLTFGTEFAGGAFIPGDHAPDGAAPHIEAWFPRELKLQTSLSNMNEGLLKQMFEDVQILNMYEPVELVLPMLVYAASTVMDVSAGENVYETALFRVEQNGAYQLFPTEVLSMAPYEGEMDVRMTGLSNLLGYFDETLQQVSAGSSEATGLAAVKSGLIVLRNLAEKGEAGALEWNLKRPDVTQNTFMMNGIVLRYPDVMTYFPMVFGMAGIFR